ncbi:MAG: DddA-like double-stranded DNA deaminase toxin [Candidatus Dormibacteraceae bacterium]
MTLFDEGLYRASSGKTSGVFKVDSDPIPLESRAVKPQNYPASGHVEGQAALIMRERGANSGILEIDNPNGICPRCVQQVPTLLPEGAELDVLTPLGTVPKNFWEQ